ncbi:hypothetical protein TNCT_169901 [Trichonephila clavata]|uniref:Uncharacterized protein n=1 Tax=Trichonephila clavata TaxID=2740835 RepID=A0A8X6IM89_TRICU|nr:hypothetical protein TNCT_169901 [Trichonephila clavata]
MRNILHKELGVQKLCTRWDTDAKVNKLFSQQCLDRFNRDQRFVTMSEAWVPHYKLEAVDGKCLSLQERYLFVMAERKIEKNKRKLEDENRQFQSEWENLLF